MSEKSKDRGQGPRDRDERGEAAESAPAFEVEDDLALSALLDGELDEASAAKLRAKMVAQPELAERSAELGELSGHLRNLAHPSERSEAERQLESDRVDRMQAALRVRLDVEAAEVAEAEAVDSDAAEAAAPAPVIPLRRARDWWAPAAALAAGLLLYLAFDSGISGVETGGPGEPPGEFAQVPDLTPDPTLDPTLDLVVRDLGTVAWKCKGERGLRDLAPLAFTPPLDRLDDDRRDGFEGGVGQPGGFFNGWITGVRRASCGERTSE